MDTNVLALRKAAEELGISDLETLRKAAKKFGALFLVAGLEYIDRARYEAGVQTELQAKIEQAARRNESKGSGGRHYGLIKARIERAPALIVAKEGAISAAKTQLAEAETKYDKARAKKLLTDLETGLKRLRDNLAKDQSDLESFLDSEPEA